MKHLLLLPLLLVPLSAGAAAYSPVTGTSTVPMNTYIADTRVSITKPLSSDLIAAGGTVLVSAPVSGDILAAGGTFSAIEGAGGDVRVIGGKLSVSGPVGGDIAAAGGTVRIHSTARNIYAAGGSVDIEGGSSGTVTIYGANVFLSGEYGGNVKIIASNRLTLGSGTHIHGQLTYSAPEALTVPPGASIDGGARYTGAYAYVPTTEQAHNYAIIGTILFFAIRVLAGVIVAGLIAGIFPAFSLHVADMALRKDGKSFGKLLALGIGITILTPCVILFLLVSFVGAGLALLLTVVYALLGLLAYAFAGIVLGDAFRRIVLVRFQGSRELSWQDAVFGTIILHIIGLIPVLGVIATFLLTMLCAGTLASRAYRTAIKGAS